MPAHAPARARPTSPAPLCTRRRRVARSNTQVIYLACASGHASTAFTVCRAVSEDLMVSQVDALLSLVSAALDDEVYCQQARAQAPCSGGALRSGGSAGVEGSAVSASRRLGGRGGGGGGGGGGGRGRISAPAKAVVLAVLRVWKTWASSDVLVAALVAQPALLACVVRVALSAVAGSLARGTAQSLLFAIATHSGKDDGADQLAVLEHLLYESASKPLPPPGDRARAPAGAPLPASPRATRPALAGDAAQDPSAAADQVRAQLYTLHPTPRAYTHASTPNSKPKP